MRSKRAQTTIDFAIGAGVFLLAVAFVVAFIPGMLEPYEGIQSETVAVDRVATQLATGLLGDPAEPYLLNTDCTVAFFADTTPTECRFDGATVTERLGIDDGQSVEIGLQADRDGDGAVRTLCWDGGSSTFVEQGDAACDPVADSGDTLLSASPSGDPPTSVGSVVVARRVVSLAGFDTTLLVRMW